MVMVFGVIGVLCALGVWMTERRDRPRRRAEREAALTPAE